MPRAADYTIQGFLYQFNKTALEIVKAQDDDTITVEGIIEDIEVASSASLMAIQCKYHRSEHSFHSQRDLQAAAPDAQTFLSLSQRRHPPPLASLPGRPPWHPRTRSLRSISRQCHQTLTSTASKHASQWNSGRVTTKSSKRSARNWKRTEFRRATLTPISHRK